MDISVIIPTYQPREYIAECLRSLSYQTLSPSRFEIIIVLNGCDEPWKGLLMNYVEQILTYHQIKFMQTNVAGVSNARNLALEVAKGDFITFIDDDDYVSPKYLEELLKLSAPYCVGLTDSIYFQDENHSLIYNNAHHNDYMRLKNIKSPSIYKSRRFFNGPVMKLIHRNIIGNRRFDIRFTNGEDSLFMALISDQIKECRFCLPEAIYYRRLRQNSATTIKRTFSIKFFNNIKLIIQYLHYWIKRPLGYNALFMSSRIFAAIKSLIIIKS